MLTCFYWKLGTQPRGPLPVWLTILRLPSCHGDDTNYSLQVSLKWCLRNEACKFSSVIMMWWTQQYPNIMDRRANYLVPPLFCPHHEWEVFSRTYFRVCCFVCLAEHSGVSWHVLDTQLRWIITVVFNCGLLAAADRQITDDKLNHLSIL